MHHKGPACAAPPYAIHYLSTEQRQSFCPKLAADFTIISRPNSDLHSLISSKTSKTDQPHQRRTSCLRKIWTTLSFTVSST
ncbi:hypothetical protein GJAV_G00129670 [Gymnothorax javanicus]|nr:hypothetical protein GJAV_G00129670 [Gymnothorax javanicus]